MLLEIILKFYKTPKASMYEIKLEKNISGFFSWMFNFTISVNLIFKT